MGSTDETIEEGILQAYLEGERQPHVVDALAHSSELQHQLALLARANERLHRLAPRTVIPSNSDLVDVATGQATPTQQLRVAAYLRESKAGRERMAYLLEGDRHPRFGALTLYLATPPLAVTGTKSKTNVEVSDDGPMFVATELAAHIVVRVQPMTVDSWRLRGYLEQQGEPLGTRQVVLRAADGRRRTRTTDTGGFFTFERLPVGSYHVRVALDAGVLLTPPIALGHEQ
jgi:hypothetical protein